MTRYLISSLIVMCIACHTRSDVSNEATRATIDSLLNIQENAYHLNSEESQKVLAATCLDSLMFIGGDDGGLVQSANSYVHDLADGYTKRPYNRSYMISENSVIVTFFQQTFKLFDGDTILFNSRMTKVFVKQNDQWKMALVTYAPLPVLYHTKQKSNPKQLQRFAGLYKSSATTTDTVSVIDNKLYLSSAGSRSTLYQIRDAEFITDGYFGVTGFVSNPQGVVEHMYYEFPDGQRIVFPAVRRNQ